MVPTIYRHLRVPKMPRRSGAAGRHASQDFVADDLGLSEITVKAHRGAVMRKVGAPTLADLVLMVEALQLGNGEDEACLSC
jgi:Bacterial regulatory proteins, luxR family